MKYGDTLRQRSIPEWGHYNIDYDYLKDLIKHHTTSGPGKALAIPGQGSSTEKAFEDTFFHVLKAQHDRINLFIKSKSGEIERRLDYIGKQLAQLQARRPSAVPGLRLQAKTVEQYAKIDADVTKAGEEIRSLSRFRVAQRTGFYKILKKYKRWTRDRELERRFKEDVLRSPDSFFQLDLGYLLDQYIDALSAVRAPLDNAGVASPHPNFNQRSSTSRLSKAIEEGVEVDFDIALSTIPLGTQGTAATYWIHPDYIVEVEVLLLQHMRLYTNSNSKPASPKDSSNATPLRRKSSSTTDRYFGNEDDVGLVVLDQPEAFAKRQSASTVGSGEEVSGALRAKAACNARWTSSGDAAVIVGLGSHQDLEDSDKISVAKLRRKDLDSFLDPSTAWPNSASSETQERSEDSTKENTDIVRRWLREHSDVKPIAGICSKRTRFVGLQNSDVGGMWAFLDRDIFMKDSLHKDFSNKEWLSAARADSVKFPHAVLEIRREGNQPPGLIHTLGRSHLVERVRGFSLEAHAVWTCCNPSTMSPPIWMPLLQSDIRKLPAPLKRQRRKAGSVTDSASHLSPPQTSTSATSATSPYTSRNGETSATSASESMEPPPLQAFRKKSRKPYADYPPPAQAEAPRTQAYWNEYDNPESEDDGYYIYFDPIAEVKFPGQEMLEAWARKTKQLLRMGKVDEEESPLMSAAEYGSSDEETAESPIGVRENYGTITANRPRRSNEGYFSGLFQSLRDPHRDAQVADTMQRQTERERQSLLTEIHEHQHERDMAKLQLYSSCLVAAAVLDITLAILTSTSRRKWRGEVNSALILGVICNLLLLLVAIASMRTRRERLGWIHQGVVLVLVLAMVAVDVLLFRWALHL